MVEQDLARDASVEDPDALLDALLAAAQEQLREVVQRATSAARRDVEAAAASVAAREIEIASLQAALAAERAHLVADREALERRAAEIGERQRAVDAAADEVSQLRERATIGLASALERSAQLVEQAEARAATRLEAVGAESEAILQRAVERGLAIVSDAEASVERSKSELRQLVGQISEYLEREKLQSELEMETHIDLRGSTGVLLDPDALHTEGLDPETTADATVEELPTDASDGSVAETIETIETTEHRVTDAVRRAVRNWSVSRQDAE
jgi:hypothetical protein